MSLAAFARASSFAAERHRTQRRKGGDGRTPYVNHPLRVASLLAEAGVDDSVVLQAAVLHDVLEDCEDTSYADLEERFGQAVASTVLECSDDKRHAKVLRKAEAVSKAPRLSEAAALVTLADKLHNLQSMAADGPPQGWSRDRVVAYAGWASEVAAPLRQHSAALAAQLDAALAALGHDAAAYATGSWVAHTPEQ